MSFKNDYLFVPKRPEYKSSGEQILLDFDKYHLSIVNDGYGAERGLYEIGVFTSEGNLCELPGITAPDDTVAGFLTESAVDGIIRKMQFLTGVENPKQINGFG